MNIKKIVEKVVDSAQAAKALAEMALGGYDSTKVAHEVFEARMLACRACPKHSPLLNQCSVCGCFLNIKARLLYDPVATSRHPEKEKQLTVCPEGKW